MKKLKESVGRNDNAVQCSCGGFAGCVNCTKEEIKAQSCGRTHECCGRAFVCFLCGERLFGNAESPEAD